MKKLDNGMVRRLKLIKYKLNFVDEPKNANDRKKDTRLKDKIDEDEDFKDAFLHLLLEYAKKHIDDDDLKQPEEFQEATAEYIEDNNPIKSLLDEHFIKTNDNKDRIPASEFYQIINSHTNTKMSEKRIIKDMLFNGFERKKSCGYLFFLGLKVKPKIDDALDA